MLNQRMLARILKKNKVVIKLVDKFNYIDVTKMINLGEEI